MNFGRIFLVKCLLLLFPSVKCSSTCRIYKAVNETALFSITAPGSIYETTWKKDGQRLVRLKGTTASHYTNKTKCRCGILQNGTLQIQSLVKNDSGTYTVTVYLKNGTLKAEENIVLFVQEPVPQPVLSAECRNKGVFLTCEAKQKPKDEAFLIELTQPNGKTIQKNATMLEWHGRDSGTFKCVFKNQISEKMSEKVIQCSGKLSLYVILSIAGGAVFFVIFVICLIYCIRRKKTKRHHDYEEERVMQTLQVDGERERGTRNLPQTPSNPTPKQVRVQQRPLPPQPQEPQPLAPRPRPRPRTQPRTPNLPRERP